MKIKDTHKLWALNTDDDPAELPQGDVTFAKNIRMGASTAQHGSGNAETLQAEIELLINPNSLITYYGSSIGGNFVYPGFAEITIGTQTWMRKNYDVAYPGSKAYDNVEENSDTYGRLYTHNQITASDFCPAGWRVPTEADIDTLLTYLGGAAIAGGKLKETGEQHWSEPNTGAEDIAGFRAMPGGKFDLLFDLLGDNCLLWLLDDGEPVAPLAINGSAKTPVSFIANWLAVEGVTGYYLDVATDVNFTAFVAGWNNKDVGDVLYDTITGLSPDTQYWYRIRAYNDVGTSPNSNVVTIGSTDGVVDFDGNVYTYVTIGTQQWMVENFRSEHYADGTAIPNLTNDINTSTNLLVGLGDWSVDPYDTLITVGSNITTAINLGGNAYCKGTSGIFLNIGDKLYYEINLTINSGSTPRLVLFINNAIQSYTILVAGINSGFLTMPSDTKTYTIGFSSTSASNFSATCVMTTDWVYDTDGAYCYYDNDEATYKPDYGALYNWYAVDNAHGLAPAGWRVPSEADFNTLIAFLGGDLVAGGKLKEVGLTHWLTPNTGATDEYGFKGLPAGFRQTNGVFAGITTFMDLWGSDESGGDGVNAESTFNSATFDTGSNDKEFGLSVRMMRDVP